MLPSFNGLNVTSMSSPRDLLLHFRETGELLNFEAVFSPAHSAHIPLLIIDRAALDLVSGIDWLLLDKEDLASLLSRARLNRLNGHTAGAILASVRGAMQSSSRMKIQSAGRRDGNAGVGTFPMRRGCKGWAVQRDLGSKLQSI